jgi:hypothetical protein
MIESFIESIRHVTGGAPSLEEILPDKWITFPVSGKRGDTKGHCKLFLNGEGGIYVNWDENGRVNWHTWQAQEPHTQERRAAFHAEVELAKKEAAKLIA